MIDRQSLSVASWNASGRTLIPFVEATLNWALIYDWLDDICDDVLPAHPLNVKAMADAKMEEEKSMRRGWHICPSGLGAEWEIASSSRRHHGDLLSQVHLRLGVSYGKI